MENLTDALVNACQSDSEDMFFLQARWRDSVNNDPVKILDELFFNIYQNHPNLSTFSQLRTFFYPHIPFILKGLVTYAEHLREGMSDGFSSNPIHIIGREVRCLCREALLYLLNDIRTPGRIRPKLLQVLNKLRITHFNRGTLSFCPNDVIGSLQSYLKEADTLAELPQFLPVIFTTDELNHFKTSLSSYRLTEEDEMVLDRLLVTPRKKHIIETLERFMCTYPIEDYTKRAFAVFISLGEFIPWTKHSFIRRLLAVSYQEGKVLSLIK